MLMAAASHRMESGGGEAGTIRRKGVERGERQGGRASTAHVQNTDGKWAKAAIEVDGG